MIPSLHCRGKRTVRIGANRLAWSRAVRTAAVPGSDDGFRLPVTVFPHAGQVSPHPSRSVRFVPGRAAKWRDQSCALPPKANGAFAEQTVLGGAAL